MWKKYIRMGLTTVLTIVLGGKLLVLWLQIANMHSMAACQNKISDHKADVLSPQMTSFDDSLESEHGFYSKWK